MKVTIYKALASGLLFLATVSVASASLIFVNNPKPPESLMKRKRS